MEVATFALILGVYEVLVGVPLLLFPRETFRWLVRSQHDNDALLRVVGTLFLIMGVLVLSGGAKITADVTGFIRFLAWITVVKCLMICWCPAPLLEMQRCVARWSPGVQRIAGLFALGLGIFMLWASCYLRCGGCCGACGS